MGGTTHRPCTPCARSLGPVSVRVRGGMTDEAGFVGAGVATTAADEDAGLDVSACAVAHEPAPHASGDPLGAPHHPARARNPGPGEYAAAAAGSAATKSVR